MSAVGEARAAEREARLALDGINRGARIAGQAAAREAEAAFLAAHDHEGARKRLALATAARIAAEDRLPNHAWEGRRVFKNVSIGRSFMPRYERVEGIVETRRSGTAFPVNARYGIPSIGEPFVRLLRKDGTPGTKFDGRMGGWELAEPASIDERSQSHDREDGHGPQDASAVPSTETADALTPRDFNA